MKKIKSLLKGSPIAMVIVGILVAGVASAGFLAVYTTITGEANVEQSVVFGNGDTERSYSIGKSPTIAGNTYVENGNLKNRSKTTAPIQFITNQCIVDGGYCNDTAHNEDGVETSYWSTVELSSKNADWNIIDGGKATLTYNLVSPEFEFEFEATGLTSEEEYSLIYYADEPDRFVDWGGNNPGALIATFTANEDGTIPATTGSKDLAMNLPHPNDYNGTATANYCNGNNGFDNYNLCRGAKIWLVLSDDYVNGELTGWNQSEYLFETDLITYDKYNTKTKEGEQALYLGEGMLNFFVKNELAVNLTPGTYKVKTQIIPVP